VTRVGERARPDRERARAAAGTALFVVFGGPALVAVLGPWLVTRWRIRPAFLGFEPFRWLGVAFLALGFTIAMDSWIRFVVQGRGTPAPPSAPKELVVSGLYRYVRNPMYVGMLAMVVGQGLLFGSWPLFVYAGGVWAVFHLFVLMYEEPTLRRQFGQSHVAYCQSVRRWIPRRRGTG